MTDIIEYARMPTMDEVCRFVESNPATSWEIITSQLGFGDVERAAVSGGRFRELWKLFGGQVDKKSRAWIEVDLLPGILRKIIDTTNALPPEKSP